MRNLKRALSLALASVMLLGMMVVGTSAASYPDVDEKDNVEAIEVLNAVKVMIGDRGNFRPDAAVNRHEMAVIMAKLVLGNEAADNYVGSHPFTDVFPWADKYVAACYENNLISGTSATTYSGNQPLTAAQAALMMLRALGYEHLTKGASDWRAPVTAMANKIGLFKGVVSSPNAQLTRNNVAQLALNALESDMVEFTGELGWEINGVNVGFQAKWEPRRDLNNVNQNGYNYTCDTTTTHQKEYLQLCEDLYDGKLIKNTKDYDDFDRPSTTWKYKGKVIGSYMNTPDAEYTTSVKLGDIYKDLALGKSLAAADVTFQVDGYETTVADSNGNALGLAKGESTKIGGNGVLTQVWYDSITETAIVTQVHTYAAKITSVGTDNGKRFVVVNELNPKGGSGQPAPLSTISSNRFETDQFAVKDLVTFTAAYNEATRMYELQTVEALEQAATGLLTRWEGNVSIDDPTGKSGANFTAGGTKYDYSAHYRVADGNGSPRAISDFKMNKSDVNVYLDKYGYAIYVSGVDGETNYAAVIGLGKTNQYGSETRGATLLLPDGTQKTVTAKLPDGTNWTDFSAAKATDDGSAVAINDSNQENLVKDGIADLVTYSVGDDGVYTLTLVTSQGYKGATAIGTAQKTGSFKDMGNDAKSGTIKAVFKTGKSEISFNTKFADVYAATDPIPGGSPDGTAEYTTARNGVYYTTSKTVFMVATNKTAGTVGDVKYSVYTGYENAPTFVDAVNNVYGIVFATNDYYTKQIDAVYIYADTMAGVTSVDTYFVKSTDANVITDSDGTAYYELPAIVKGEITTVKIQANLSKNWMGGGSVQLDAGNGATVYGAFGLTDVVKNSKGIITGCTVSAFNKIPAGTGTVAADGIVLGLNGNERTADFVAYNDATKVYKISTDYKTITAIRVEDVQTDTNDDVWANWDSDSKKLTDVLIHEVNDTVTPPSVTTSPNNVEKLTIGSSEIRSIEAARPDGSTPFAGISKYLQDGLKYEYNSDLKRLTVSGKITMAFADGDTTNIPEFGTVDDVITAGAATYTGAKWVSFIPIPVGNDWIILYYVDTKVGTTNIPANRTDGVVTMNNEAFTIVWDLDWSKYPNP